MKVFIRIITFVVISSICTVVPAFEKEDVNQRVELIAETKFLADLFFEVADPTLQTALNVADIVAVIEQAFIQKQRRIEHEYQGDQKRRNPIRP